MRMRLLVLFFALCITTLAMAGVPPASEVSDQVAQPIATEELSEKVVLPPPTPKAVEFYRSGIVLWVVQTLWDLLLPAVILFSGLSARIRTLATRLGRKSFFTTAIYFVLFVVLASLATLPLEFYSGYIRLHAYGLSNQTLTKWTTDSLTSMFVTAIVGALLLWIPYLLIRKSPRRWWFYTGLLTFPFFILTLLVGPVWIDPLYNNFGPMQDKELEAKIVNLADRAGIDGGVVYEVDMSQNTKAYNAYVTGVWNTKRIVLWDTTIKGLTEPQLLYVMAHEMGHYVLGHAYYKIVLFSALFMLEFYLIYRASGWIIARYRRRIGFDELGDVASLPLILLLMTATSFILQPISLGASRHFEHESDRFGLELVQDNQAAAGAFVKLFTENLGYPNPHPLVVLWRSSHPPLAQRVDFCNEYHPWSEGQPLRYGGLFDQSAGSAR